MTGKNVVTMLLIAALATAFRCVAQDLAKSQPPPSGAAEVAKVGRSSEVLIGSGDLLEVSVHGAPEYHYEVRVGSDGNIVLPLAGPIHIAGLAIPQAQSAIALHLQEVGAFNGPQVLLFAKEYATEGISVLGEVQKPGIYPLMGPRTLLDVISAAGGTTPKAGTAVTITHRDQPAASQTVALAYNADGEQVSNVPVLPGDTVVVSRAGIVYVVGDVRDPAGIVMENSSLTVVQALAMVHGANSTAKLSAAKLIRRDPTGPQEIPIPLDKILAAQRPDVPLQPEDIVFVPGSAAKSAARRGLEAIVQAATGVAIYHR